MSFKNKRIILTGATGGLGTHIARMLLDAGAKLLLAGTNEEAADELRKRCDIERTVICIADITDAASRDRIVKVAEDSFQGIDMLINNAGINPFGSFVEQDPALIQKTMEVNMLAPMMLTHAVLPIMQKQNRGQIVNIGSTFGSIAFAWFTAYSASKFALRGFSQGLRRELADTGIDVTYIAPRGIKTKLNSAAVYEMAKVIKMNMDEPVDVADQIIDAIRQRKKECYIGFPESLFVRVNALMPGLVDVSLKNQNQAARPYALKE
ncbi:MAG: SDR family oxidoreductase [Gammaproteobacteria bacterium]